MKLSDFIAKRELPLDQAADEIGGVSVSGLRKWIAQERIPRPDQMRRVFEWSDGEVAPNDFVLPAVDHPTSTDLFGEKIGATSRRRHAKSPPALSRGAA